MGNKVLAAYVALDFLFVSLGAIILGFSVIVQNTMNEVPTTGEQAARNLLYQRFPLTAGIANAVFYFITFLLTIPGIITPARGWVKMAGYMTTVAGFFSLILGLYIWILTLTTKNDFSPQWVAAGGASQDLMQISFNCCGYFNSSSPAFVTNSVCTSPAAAALMRGCATPITAFANVFMDNIFTAVFGVVGIDAVFVVSAACLLKERKERERFRHIDEKSGRNGTL